HAATPFRQNPETFVDLWPSNPPARGRKSTKVVGGPGPRSHAENAVATAHSFHRDGMDHRKAHTQYRSGIARVDHTVVVQHPRREIRQRFFFDLFLNRGAHHGVALLVVGFALGLGRSP